MRRDGHARSVRRTGRAGDEAELGQRGGALRATARGVSPGSERRRTDETGLDMTASQMVLASLRSVKAETATSGVAMLMLFVERSIRALDEVSCGSAVKTDARIGTVDEGHGEIEVDDVEADITHGAAQGLGAVMDDDGPTAHTREDRAEDLRRSARDRQHRRRTVAEIGLSSATRTFSGVPVARFSAF